eukprot:CAMPEP_0119493920 /NCGR_PEP_ID=MMETSP1344-20130328/18027_1 /TAXON_ID=236787 /ORGANISM="Florenciella parvula, Strain CCMP2471" /LENGTH=444 /DNA_ID=CAMNT_0007529383 /DNA_START=66 /DNA_END=1396 /DNA_ORIENTATION=-
MDKEFTVLVVVVLLGLLVGFFYGLNRMGNGKLPTHFKDKPTPMNLYRDYQGVFVPLIICLWYLCSVISNNAGKLVLPMFPYPLTLSLVQFLLAASSVPLARGYQGLPIAPLLALPLKCWQRGLVLGSAGVVSNVMHRVALMYIPVSFAHTVKAVQPFFSVLLSYAFLGQTFSHRTIMALLVVVGGVALSAFKEPQFSFIGFFAAGSSALSMSVGSVSQKKFLQRSGPGSHPSSPNGKERSKSTGYSPDDATDYSKSTDYPVDSEGGKSMLGGSIRLGKLSTSASTSPSMTMPHSNLSSLASPIPNCPSIPASCSPSSPIAPHRLEKGEVFFLTAVYSALLVAPVWLVHDASALLNFSLSAPVVSLVLANTATNVLQHFISLSVLALITPVSHSVMNSLKRVVVITISVLYFRNTVSGLNGLGICLALGGVLLYERSVRVPVGSA